jgi:formyltetrahydrofolate deformylase
MTIVRTSIGPIRERVAGFSADPKPDIAKQDVGGLLICCPDRPGIVAAVSRFLYDSGANILESQQYSTGLFGGTFFLLIEFHLPGLSECFDVLEDEFTALSEHSVLARAVAWHVDDRVIVHQNKTIVFA